MGDFVLARHEHTFELGYFEVVDTVVRESPSVLRLIVTSEVGNEEIVVTEEHPFYTERGWIAAGELQVDENIITAGDHVATVVSLEEHSEAIIVYNLTVRDAHTYFVGESQMWVHNTCEECGPNGDKLENSIASKGSLTNPELDQARRDLYDTNLSDEARAAARQKLDDALNEDGISIVSMVPISVSGHQNETYDVTLSNGLHAVWEPDTNTGIVPSWESNSSSMANAAAYEIDRHLGHIGGSPPVVRREIPNADGNLQTGALTPYFDDVDFTGPLPSNTDDSRLIEVALFDWISGNTSRTSDTFAISQSGDIVPVAQGSILRSTESPDFHVDSITSGDFLAALNAAQDFLPVDDDQTDLLLDFFKRKDEIRKSLQRIYEGTIPDEELDELFGRAVFAYNRRGIDARTHQDISNRRRVRARFIQDQTSLYGTVRSVGIPLSVALVIPGMISPAHRQSAVEYFDALRQAGKEFQDFNLDDFSLLPSGDFTAVKGELVDIDPQSPPQGQDLLTQIDANITQGRALASAPQNATSGSPNTWEPDTIKKFEPSGIHVPGSRQFWVQTHVTPNGEPIQFSFEFEGQSHAIKEFYYPLVFSEEGWKSLDPVVQDRYINHPDVTFGENSWGLRSDAPQHLEPFLREEFDGQDVWEVATDGYVSTPRTLFDNAQEVTDPLEVGRGHWHTSFVFDPQYAEHYLQYAATQNEVTFAMMIAGSPEMVHHSHLGPYNVEALDKMRPYLADFENLDSDQLIEFDDLSKFNTFAFRVRPYETGRAAFETRGLPFSDDHTNNQVMVHNNVRFLENPDGEIFRFSQPEGYEPGDSYTIADHFGVERLGANTLEKMPHEVRVFFTSVEWSSPDLSIRSRDRFENITPLGERWAFPYVPFEERPHVSAEHAERIITARENYENGLRDVMTRVQNDDLTSREAQAEIELLEHYWALEVRLWEIF